MKYNRYLFTLLLTLMVCAIMYAQPSASNSTKKMKFLIHITCGSENPTKAALVFLVAKTALDEGHTVSLFLAGDAAPLLKDAELDKVVGVGTGKLRDHYEAIVKAGGKFFVSGMSAKARGMTEADIAGKPAELAMPTVLVKLAAESDRMFTY
jgi:predicted peroxiredoxin